MIKNTLDELAVGENADDQLCKVAEDGLDELFACPNCKSALRKQGTAYSCVDSQCSATYPIVNGIPVLIDERNSTFRQSDYFEQSNGRRGITSSLRKWVRAITPKISANFAARRNFLTFAKLLLKQAALPVVLIVGGAEPGAGRLKRPALTIAA